MQDEVMKEEAKKEEVQQKEVSQEEVKQVEVKLEEVKQEEAWMGEGAGKKKYGSKVVVSVRSRIVYVSELKELFPGAKLLFTAGAKL